MTPTIVKAADAAQFLSLVPRMLGYRPVRSLVLIPFRATRSLGAMRFDLPPDDESAERIASTVIGMVCRLPDADAIAAIAYTDASFAPEGMPHRALLDALASSADACGIGVRDLLCVAADAWASAFDPANPPGGRPLGELDGDEARLIGLPAPDGDQASGAELPDCAPEERDGVARALGELRRALAALSGSGATAPGEEPPAPPGAAARDLGPVPGPVTGEPDETGPGAERVDPRALATAARLDDLPELFEDALHRDPDALDAYEIAAIGWCLARPSLRDIALVQWSGNLAQGDEALTAQLRWESGEEYPPHLAMRMWGEGDAPSPARLDRALQLTRRVAASVPGDAQPGALAMCAWLAWALGRSTHAAAYADAACGIDPDHGLSQIVLSFVGAAHLPDWAFRR
ncbi:DUF4192 family protein [Microbacterium jejuense]|uniref:DUF4192 family protein n=1 Tax=Microbacterium jejuense TaxID=1263637 RepID=A0ABS7HPQ2_9MICO|nr:DUF4192 family protein [Microbacterium jejuense]MBW9094941.1 DUF4192 family protein [Microbacterium jejuense]